MSGELDVGVGGARRALAELAGPAVRLLEDLAAAEARAAELEPSLPLLAVDLFGGITVPGQEARPGKERRARRGPTGIESLAATGRAFVAGSSPAAPAGGVASRLLGVAPAPAASGPLFRLAAAGSRAAGAGRAPGAAGAGVTGTGRADVGGTAEGSGAPPEPASAPFGGAVARAAAAEAAGGTVALLAQLTESILAATAGIVATGVPGSRRAPAARPGQETGSIAEFLAETLRSAGGETAAAFGLEPGVREQAAATGLEAAVRGDTPVGAGGPGAKEVAAPRGRRGEPVAAPAAAGSTAGIVPQSGVTETDPAVLAGLVNDALVEQARRHGLELG